MAQHCGLSVTGADGFCSGLLFAAYTSYELYKKTVPIPKLPGRKYAQQSKKRFFPNLTENPFTMPLKRVKIYL